MTSIYKVPFAATGDKDALAVTDPGTGKVSLPTGFTSDYEKPAGDPARRPVGRREFNGILNEVTQALGEVQQYGFAQWTAITGGWPQGARVDNAGTVYISTVASNTATPGVPGSNWDIALGTAAARNTGTGAGEVPLNSQLGTAAAKNTGVAAGEVPTNADLGAAAFRAVGVGASNSIPDLNNIQNGDTMPKVITALTFNATTNTITAAGNWTPALKLAVGDVIQVAGTSSNNKIFTVESFTLGSIVVNAAHANGAGPLSLVTETTAGTAQITRLAKWYSTSDSMGRNWVNVAASRVAGTVYTNSTGRAIQVAISLADGAYGNILVGGLVAASMPLVGSNPPRFVSITVPNGSTYQAAISGVGTWLELR